MPFTPEELAEMAAADAEIEAAELTLEDYRETDARDRAVRMERKGPKGRRVAAQKKAYREANRDKAAAYHKAYHEKNREKVAAQKRSYYEKNRERIKARQRAYYEKNRERIKARQRAYYEKNRGKTVKSAAAGCARPDSGRKEI